MVMFARQMGQPRARLYTSSAQDEQKRRCPHGTRAMLLSRAWGHQTDFAVVSAVAVCGTVVGGTAAVASDTAALSAITGLNYSLYTLVLSILLTDLQLRKTNCAGRSSCTTTDTC